jgi:hypothetical protein
MRGSSPAPETARDPSAAVGMTEYARVPPNLFDMEDAFYRFGPGPGNTRRQDDSQATDRNRLLNIDVLRHDELPLVVTPSPQCGVDLQFIS